MLVFVCYHEEVTSWFICSSSELEKSTYEFKNVKEMVQQNSFHTESEMRELILKMLLITFSHKCGISPPTHNCIHLTTLLLFESSLYSTLYNSAFRFLQTGNYHDSWWRRNPDAVWYQQRYTIGSQNLLSGTSRQNSDTQINKTREVF